MRLLADIGGTNARFAVTPGKGTIDHVSILPVSGFSRFEDALASYRGRLHEEVTDVAIAAAGPVVDGQIRMTNAEWEISARAVHAVCPGVPVHVVNDLAAVALALPVLGPSDLVTLNEGTSPARPAPRLCVNVGTGFGAAVALFAGGCWHALATEAGHMTLAPRAVEEHDVLDFSTCVENVLSGPGLAKLTRSIGDTSDAKRLFSRLLGRVAGDLVLATGSWGGLYLCGGVLTSLEETVELEAFWGGLNSRTGLARRLSSVPVHHILSPEPAFIGLCQLQAS